MKIVFVVISVLLTSLSAKSQVNKSDSVLWVNQDTIKPDTILLPDGVTSAYDSSWLPTISIDPTFVADFAEWSSRNFTLRRDIKGRFWHMHHDATNWKFTDKDVFDLFNSIRKKRKPTQTQPS